MLFIGMIILGTYLDLPVISYLAIGLLFGGGFLLAVVATVLMFVRAKKTADKMDEPTRSEEQNAESNEQEPAYPENQYAAAEKVIARSIHGFRRSSKKTKVLSILFLSSTLGSVFAGMIFMFFNQLTAAYVCFGCFAAIILIGILCAVIASRFSRGGSSSGDDKTEYKTATVTNRMRAPHAKLSENGEPTYYLYLLNIDGKQVEARHAARYETGATVAVRYDAADGYAFISDWQTEKLLQNGEKQA